MEKEIQIFRPSKQVESNSIGIEKGIVYSFPIHGHIYYEILVYEAFDGELTINGRHIDARTPTAILITPNDFHSTTLYGTEPAVFFKIQIQASAMESFSEHVFLSSVLQDPQKASMLMQLSAEAFAHQNDASYLFSCAQTIALTLQKSDSTIQASQKSIALIRQAIDEINLRFSEQITLDSISRALHVTPQYLSNLFSKYAEMSFVEYLSARRLRFASIELRSGASVTDACYRSGYRNLSHFIRSFKKKYGTTPSKSAK